MSELITKLTAEAQHHQGSPLGSLLQWSVLHIQSLEAALAEAQEERETEENERIRLERVLFQTKLAAEAVVYSASGGLVPPIALARDHAPHINIMAHHGVVPYAKKPRAKKA
jgi:hypothetical protein